MKSSHQIIFLLSYCMFGAVFAMETEVCNKDTRFIDIVDHEVVDTFVGGHPIYYDNKYKVRKFQKNQKNIISFPVKPLGLLPIESYGEKRFFNTFSDYATGNPLDNRGDVWTIIDPTIRQGAVVAGTVCYHDNAVSRIYVYLGFNASNFRSLYKGRKIIYPAKVLALEEIKEATEYIPRISQLRIFEGVTSFDDTDMLEEAKRQFSEIENRDWDDILVRSLMKQLLGRNVEDFNFKERVFTQSYWNKRAAAFTEIINSY